MRLCWPRPTEPQEGVVVIGAASTGCGLGSDTVSVAAEPTNTAQEIHHVQIRPLCAVFDPHRAGAAVGEDLTSAQPNVASAGRSFGVEGGPRQPLRV